LCVFCFFLGGGGGGGAPGRGGSVKRACAVGAQGEASPLWGCTGIILVMYKILTLNKIAEEGLRLFPKGKYETGDSVRDPDAVLVRSADMLGMRIPDSVLAIARAGAGYNNIPVGDCSERGIVVFNTPGANANAVKELTVASLFLSSRKIVDSILWTRGYSGDALAEAVEKEKSKFGGPEIRGKTLGVIGLGAIGVMVANDAQALGMEVIGFDPYISVDSAWNLSRSVHHAELIETLLINSDYVTIHVPYSEATKNLLCKKNISIMRKSARVINLARGGLVNEDDIIAALDEDVIAGYVTDFPSARLAAHRKVICFPHLGASTPEAEINCASAAVRELINFLEHGIIENSVNYPRCYLEHRKRPRLLIANKNIPNMVGQITTALAENSINITDLINHHRGDYAFNIIDTGHHITEDVLNRIRGIEGVLNVRLAGQAA